MKPVFIFSLPRAGSSWLQRVLAQSSEIATTSEPWILLAPLMPLLGPGHAYSLSGFDHINIALEDVVALLPKGKEDYYGAVRDFAFRLYQKLSNDRDFKYFLDKTPRYHFIAKEVHETFPDAKIIYLWRNPLAVAASIYDTWGNRRVGIARSRVDLFQGMQNLLDAHRTHASGSLTLKYEDLILNFDDEMAKLSDFLGVEFPGETTLRKAEYPLCGTMGDPLAAINQAKPQDARLNSWVNTFRPLLRRRWAESYLSWIGQDNMAYMGYNYEVVLNKLRSEKISCKYIGKDLSRMVLGAALTYFDVDAGKRIYNKVKYGKRVFPYT